MAEQNEIAIVDEQSLREKVYIVRGQQVMLDSDLAEIYGYEVKTLNQQVRRNIERFPEDFMFQLTKEELMNLKSQNVTSSWGGVRKLPYAFTEQGIYQLATVLRGELAVKQSVALMRVFRAMREYIAQNRPLLSRQEVFQILDKQARLEGEVGAIKDNMVTKSELSELMKLFDYGVSNDEILILDGQPFKADAAYQKIYGKAKKSIILVDEYLGVKTLQHLAHAKGNVKITIISDNKGKYPLRLNEYNDFVTEYPNVSIDFIKSENKAHDRYIVLDYGTKEMKVYHSGASVKDAGKKIMTITQLKDIDEYKNTIKGLLQNAVLQLK